MPIKIQSLDGRTLFEGDFASLKDALVMAVESRAYLSRANLSRADLSGAYLSWAYLSRADLSGAYLSWANLSRANLSGAYLSRANLSWANLSGADLSWANLSGAYLSRADLSGADLSGADLSGANLSGAYLSLANLSGATGFNPKRTDTLQMLRDQPGKIRAYKLVTADGKSPIAPQHGHRELTYKVGKVVEVKANEDEGVHCSHGVNLGDLCWVMREWQAGYRILVCEFTAKDIAAIPYGNDGKFRVHRCKVVGEKDLVEIGLLEGPVKAKKKTKKETR